MRFLATLTLGLLLMVAAGPAAAAEPTLPDTPAGRRAAALVDMLKTGTDAAARSFITENYADAALAARPVEARMGAWQGLREDMADPELLEAGAAPGAIRLVIRSKRSGEAFELRMEHEPAEPFKLTGVRVQPTVPGLPPLPDGPMTDAQRTAAIDQLLDRLAADDRFSGTVLVARDGQPIYRKAVGLASKSFDVPNDIDTKFCLGSMNKMFTATAIAQLAEQGKLSFGDRVGKYLPDLRNADLRDKVTIRQLLTHSSGLGSYFDSPYYEAHWPKLRRVADYRPIVEDDTLDFAPGDHFQYSNTGFVVLGMIIEKVSGQDYFDYIRQHIYAPAGMTDSDTYENDRPVKKLAVGYTDLSLDGEPESHHGRTNVFMHSARGTPAGGGYSTVGDLLRFDQALRSGKLVGAAMLDSLTTPKVPMGGPGGGYGFGFGAFTFGNRRHWGHNGGAPGISAELRSYADGSTIAVLSNYDRAIGIVVDYIDRLMAK